MTAQDDVDLTSEDRSEHFQIEPTFVSSNPTLFCMFPEWLLLLFSVEIPSEPILLEEDGATTSSSPDNDGADPPSVDPFAPVGDAIIVQVMGELPIAGTTVPMMTTQTLNRLPSGYAAPYVNQAAANSFQLRTGPDYYRKKRKAPSMEAFMDLVGMDFVHTPQGRLDNVGKHVHFLPEWRSISTSSSTNPNIPPIFIVNVQCAELFKHTFFGSPIDVPGTAFIFYFKFKQDAMDAIANPGQAPPALRLLADYMANGPEAYAEMNRRRVAENSPTGIFGNKYFGKFKIILRCDNLKDPSMAWVPSVASSYNEKPTVITYSGNLLRGPGYVEMDIDVRQFGLVAGATIPLLMKNLHHAVNSVAFCIESTQEDEMPERAFGCATMHKLSVEDLADFHPGGVAGSSAPASK